MKQSPHKDQLPIVTTLLSILIGGTGVAMGAFGAHFLASRLSDKQAAIFAVAVDYHQLYSVVLLVLWMALIMNSNSMVSIAICRSLKLFLSAIIIFSGSLYLYLVSDWSLFMKITPIGGSGLIISWVSLWWVIKSVNIKNQNQP